MTNLKDKSINSLFEFSLLLFYLWYFLPIVNVHLQGTTFKLLFFGFLTIGIVGFLVCNGINFNSITCIVLLYYAIFLFMAFLNIDDTNKTIRVNFIFFGLALIYFGILPEKSKISFGKKILLLFAITALTSAIGVIIDESAARTLSHAAADDNLQAVYQAKNISGIYMFQSLVYFVPLLVCLPKTRKAKLFSFAAIIILFIVILNASFTISLIVFLISLALSIILRQKGANRFWTLILSVTILSLLFINGESILTSIANIINNNRVSTRIIELKNLIYNRVATGDAELRLELYTTSIKTFIEHPFGVGAFYSYITFENGIGYHSQILDDLARYGVFAIAFYVLFFISYYRILKKEYNKINAKQVAGIVIVVYMAFLTFNIGFRSAEESVCMFLILPLIPTLISNYTQKSKKI